MVSSASGRPVEDVAKLTYFGLYALQHRGQESAGIAVSNGRQILVYKDMGLVSQVFDESTLEALKGFLAIGHARYSTTGASTWHNAQPTFHPTAAGSIALAHNGNLTNTSELAAHGHRPRGPARRARPARSACPSRSPTTPAWSPRCSPTTPTAPSRRRRWSCCRRSAARSPSSGWTRTRCTPPATRRASGRSCSAVSSGAGWSPPRRPRSTSSARRTSARSSPARWSSSTPTGCARARFAEPAPKHCLFEFVYLARPDTLITGQRVHSVRVEIGRRLARDFPADADLVIPVPESGTPAAIGYAEESGIPYGVGLVKNSYVGRTFIQPSQTIRQLGIRLKLNPLRDIIEGKKLVVVDDSIVRGNTQRALIRMLREAGAREVHVRISSPPVKWPCFYGIDFATRAELIANGLDNDEIRRSIDADSLGYISLEQLVEATNVPMDNLCRACFDGVYPVRAAGAGAARQEPPRDPAADRDRRAGHRVDRRRRLGRAATVPDPTLPEIAEPRSARDRPDRSPHGRHPDDGVRRRGRLDRGRRPGRGADEGLGREGPAPRDDRRHRRLRRAVRRQRAEVLQAAAAGQLRRRRRHQGGDRAGARQARHDRFRPGRDARRRPRRVRRGAAVPHRLHRHRPGRPRADRRDRQGHRRGVRRGRLRADRRRDRRAPGPARARRVRRRGVDHRCRRGRRPARPRPGPSRRRGDRHGGVRAALQRLLPGPARAAARTVRAGRSTGTSTSWAARSARSCWSRPGSTPRPAWAWRRRPARTRCRTSPAVASRPTSPG